jgi:hypothetical protein
MTIPSVSPTGAPIFIHSLVPSVIPTVDPIVMPSLIPSVSISSVISLPSGAPVVIPSTTIPVLPSTVSLPASTRPPSVRPTQAPDPCALSKARDHIAQPTVVPSIAPSSLSTAAPAPQLCHMSLVAPGPITTPIAAPVPQPSTVSTVAPVPSAIPAEAHVLPSSTVPTMVPDTVDVPAVLSFPGHIMVPSIVPVPSVAPPPVAELSVALMGATMFVPSNKPTVVPHAKLPSPFLDTLHSKYRPKTKPPPSGRPMSPTSVWWEPSIVSPAPNELNQLINEASQLFLDSSTWEDFVPKVRDTGGDFATTVGKIPHPSAHLLNRFRIGGDPVACSGTHWSFAQKAAALTRGPHQSSRQHIPFLRQEFVGMIRKGHWTFLPARLVLNELQLRLSPLGVVPQHDRQPRTIIDSSFFGVNHENLALSTAECMKFGKALWLVLRHLKSKNPHLGPVYLSNIDIADDFYRIWVRASDVPKLGVLFPSTDG